MSGITLHKPAVEACQPMSALIQQFHIEGLLPRSYFRITRLRLDSLRSRLQEKDFCAFVLYFGSNPRKNWQGNGKVRQEMKEAKESCINSLPL